jgi:hypothetical protein
VFVPLQKLLTKREKKIRKVFSYKRFDWGKNTVVQQSVYQNWIKGRFRSYKVFALILKIMKKVLLLSLVVCLFTIVKAQKVYFVYLQSENAAPFYVRMGDKVMSSSPEGYLILPKLVDSTYAFSVGQPGKRNEGQFSININKNDRGFLIRELDGSLSLFDLQSLSTYKSIAPSGGSTKLIRRNDHFTALLAKAADDTTLLYQAVVLQPQKTEVTEKETVAVKEEPVSIKGDTVATKPAPAEDIAAVEKEDTVSVAAAEKDTVAITDTANTVAQTTAASPAPSLPVTAAPDAAKVSNLDTATAVKEPVTVETPAEEYKRSTVIKKSESSLSSGFSLVFLDSYEGGVDTISLSIPNPAIFYADTVEKPADDNKQFLDISIQPETPEKRPSKKRAKEVAAEKPKPACTDQATDDDFFKLRRDMAAEKEEEDMIAQAKKYFRNKCFRTEHIKYLSTLFLTDAGKYRFFDTAYFYVYDKDKFGSLQSEMKDAYYINRFKALVAN